MGLDIEAAFNKADTDHSGFIGKFFSVLMTKSYYMTHERR